MANQEQLESLILERKWFYQFHLPGGQITETYLPDYAQPIHTTRARMMNKFLDDEFGGGFDQLRCADLACHEGFFAHKLADKGFKEVVGVDARTEHIEHANLIRQVYSHQNLSFKIGDIQKLEAHELGSFDATLMFGILYHLENVVGALRLARAITNKVCLIETQVTPNLTGITDWGSNKFTKEIVGCLAIIDETGELSIDNKEANITPISIVPSLQGLLWLLKAVGFKSSRVIAPPPDAYEQLADGKRVIVAAYAS